MGCLNGPLRDLILLVIFRSPKCFRPLSWNLTEDFWWFLGGSNHGMSFPKTSSFLKTCWCCQDYSGCKSLKLELAMAGFIDTTSGLLTLGIFFDHLAVNSFWRRLTNDSSFRMVDDLSVYPDFFGRGEEGNRFGDVIGNINNDDTIIEHVNGDHQPKVMSKTWCTIYI